MLSDCCGCCVSCDLLLSFAFHAKTDLQSVKAALGVNQMLMIDSGAFTAYTLGKPISIDNYIAYLQHWYGVYDYAMNLDVIGNPRATAKNLLTLQGHGLNVVPIYTARAKVAELRAMTKDAEYIAYGGLVGVPKRLQIPATKTVVDIAASNGARVHALGQTSAQMFDYAAPYSGDSSKASTTFRWRQLPLYDERTNSIVTIKIGDSAMIKQHLPLIRQYGLHARPLLDSSVCTHAHLRVPHYAAGIISIARLAKAMQNKTDSPHIYSSLTTAEALEAGKIAAQVFRERYGKDVA